MTDSKTIFVAGATGAIGRPLCRLLINDGFTVFGTTRFAAKADALSEIGVTPVVVDVYNADALTDAVVNSRTDVVIHQLTDLPPALDPAQMPAALVRNARIRDEGTRNLIAAARAAGVKRVIAQSIAFSISDALMAFERQVLDAPLEGIVLRYGRLYGPGTGFDSPAGPPPHIHVDRAADAARRAVTTMHPGLYVITDTEEAHAPSHP